MRLTFATGCQLHQITRTVEPMVRHSKMGNTHKAQHWIPKSYLEAWIDPEVPSGYEPYVNMISKDGREAKRRSPANTFTETDLYTAITPNGKRDLRLEHGLSTLESNFAIIRREHFASRRPVCMAEFSMILFFVAAMHFRTPAMRDHQAKFWQEIADLGNRIEVAMQNSSEEQRRRAVSTGGLHGGRSSMDLEQVRQIAERTMQHMLIPAIAAEAELLAQMRCVVMCTHSDPGFITSDAPVVWYDPEWFRKPPMWRSACFNDPRLEITVPISPIQVLMFVHGPTQVSYLEVGDDIVAEINRRTRFHCNSYFIARRAYLERCWFDPGQMPEDAWERTHPAGET
jgi:hypothetical protein